MKVAAIDIIRLKERLEKHHGSFAEIARRSSKSYRWVDNVFKKEKYAKYMSLKIYEIALDVCDELEQKESKRKKRIDEKKKRMNMA